MPAAKNIRVMSLKSSTAWIGQRIVCTPVWASNTWTLFLLYHKPTFALPQTCISILCISIKDKFRTPGNIFIV